MKLAGAGTNPVGCGVLQPRTNETNRLYHHDTTLYPRTTNGDRTSHTFPR
jgi:hypothetical protein